MLRLMHLLSVHHVIRAPQISPSIDKAVIVGER